MKYLSTYRIPGPEECEKFLSTQGLIGKGEYRYLLNVWDEYERYPFDLFKQGKVFEFDTLTLFYGNNGCGKSTLLNLIAASLRLKRRSDMNMSPFFTLFCEGLCRAGLTSDFEDIGRQAEIITSDDVFKHLLLLRSRNREITKERNAAIDYIFRLKASASARTYVPQAGRTPEERKILLEEKKNLRHTSSRYVREHSDHNLRNHSNGESALDFFTSIIRDEGLYLLDEPEKSLSPSFQIKLMEYLQCSMRLGCQFVIATHSPLLLGMPGARIYNLDDPAFPVTDWHDLENIRIYHGFFKAHEKEFSENA